jgi:hypothetical protein
MASDHDANREDALEWFLTGFSARDLAEPLHSVDEGSPGAAAVFETNRIDVLGVRKQGKVDGWISRNQLSTAGLTSYQPFDPATLVADSAPLSEVVCSLNTHPRLFVRACGHVCGVIPHAAIEKPPLRMWLFGLVTISEQRVTRLIDRLFPDDAWQDQLSSGRLAKARELQELRRRRGQHPALLDCLQFADKGQIVARNELLRCRTRFSSRAAVDRFVQALQDLRNNLAHSQDIAGDWDVIHELAANVHQIVCGPAASSEPAP